MKITELSIVDLRRALRATERLLGADSNSAAVLRKELVRRSQGRRKKGCAHRVAKSARKEGPADEA